ncbi:MAG: TIGR00282 family metallophosphoesterase [Mariprofundaceae bacterium]|nr:TIGR00282 family metallophosphoesterase [Mariprofundaceae bacterium]
MPELLKILAIGDVIGRAGRRALRSALPGLIDHHQIDFVIANGENLAAGFGLTEKTADEMFKLGVDVLTNGNHCWDQRDIMPVMDRDERFVRPANFTSAAPGRGWTVRETAAGHRIAVINLIGQVFMGGWDCPFAAADRALNEIPQDVSAIIVDMHAEATSEKVGMGWHLDGRASFVFGTHTHIPTCDETILPDGCAYQTDLGMTGCYQSIIGMQVEGALQRMIDRMPRRFVAAERGGSIFATMVAINPETRRAEHIERIHIPPA